MREKIRLGQCWVARLTKCDMTIRIEDYLPKGGWVARSLSHGRTLWIRKADQLLYRCNAEGLQIVADETEPNRRSTALPPDPLPDVALVETNRKDSRFAPDPCLHEEQNFLLHDQESDQRERLIPSERKPQSPAVAHGPPTLLDAAVVILRENRRGMSSKEIIAAVQEKGFWTPTGKTPWLTLHTALSREIESKGESSRFKRGKQRGQFMLR